MNSRGVIATLANAAWAASNARAYFNYCRALQDPGKTQHELLMRYVRTSCNTAFGRAHGFADIRSSEDFERNVPLADYDDLRPWIDRIAGGEKNVLTADPVTRLIPTTGSTQARKLIPYTVSLQREINLAIGPWICDLFKAEPGLMCGPAYWSITPALRPIEAKQSTIPIGFDEDSAYLCGLQKRLVDSVMVTPAWVQQVDSIEAFRYITLLLLLLRSDLRLLSVWHPSFLSQLLLAMESNWDALLHDIENGGCRVAESIPNVVRATALARFTSQPDRARELARCDPSAVDTIWPDMKLISCWADGHAAAAAKQLAALYPFVHIQPKGLLATEGAVTIPFTGKTPVAVRSHFFEFLDAAGTVRGLSDLTAGTDYEVVMTTAGGLWRYRLYDRVRVTGFLERTPCLQFIGRSGLVSDRFGEKLSEAFVAGALHSAFKQLGLSPAFAMLAPDTDAATCHYTLYAERPAIPGLAAALDQELSKNPGYAYCRTLGQLQHPRVFVLKGPGFNNYSNHLLNSGMRLGDIKPAALSLSDHWSSVFDGDYLPLPSAPG